MFRDFLAVLEAAVQSLSLVIPEIDWEAELEQFNKEAFQVPIILVWYNYLIVEV
jgi:hypothetical protein